MQPDELLAIGERIVEKCLSRGADEAEAYVSWEDGQSVDIEGGKITCASTSQEHGFGVRVLRDHRMGFACASRLDKPGRVIDAALQLAPHGQVSKFAFPASTKLGSIDETWDDQVAYATPDEAMQLAQEVLATWKQESPTSQLAGGGIGLGQDARAIVNSNGVQCADRSTSISASASLVLDGTSHWESTSSHKMDVDVAQMTAKACSVLGQLQGATTPTWDGPQPILFSPEAAAELLGGFATQAATGEEAMRGNSMWSKDLGKTVANSGLSLTDDALASGALGAAKFDDEGATIAPQPIIANGVLATFLYDTWDALEHDQTPTASAVRSGYGSRPTTGAHHLIWSHRNEASLENMMAGIDKGYYVHSVLGAHTANATTGAFSITAANVLAISGGQWAGAVSEIALSGTIGALLKNVEMASETKRRMHGAMVPEMLISDVSVSL